MVTIDQIIAQKMGEIMIGEWPIGNFILCIIAMLLSVVLCGAIGIERERKGRNAGLRTHLLVGMGSCLIMIISIYGFPITVPDDSFKRDVARLAAAVVTGVGFLGAGAIIHRSSGIKGLTTAVTIWMVMAIGLACGSMNFILAIASTLLILLVLVSFKHVEVKLNRKAPTVRLIVKKDIPLVSKILEVTQASDCSPQQLELDILDNKDVEISFQAVATGNGYDTAVLISKLEQLEGVIQVEVSHNQKK